MPLLKTIRGILINKREKTFKDGTKGAFCQIVDKEGNLLSFWAPGEFADDVGEVESVEEYRDSLALTFVLSIREWDGVKKHTLVEVQ